MAELLFGHITKTPQEVEAEFPPRGIEGNVTRFAPSPTGFMHIGGLFAALICQRVAHQTGGVFFLRIEDTDKKREVEGGVEEIVNSLSTFGIEFDEGATSSTTEKGEYGPYRQSQRASIYQTFAKSLVEQGKAYPCFCTEEELGDIRSKQESIKANPGYYGEWAVHRDMPFEQVKELVIKGVPYVLRLKSNGSLDKKVECKDGIKGKIEMPQNDQDIVILKSDGIPTYHFAHAVDDHLMGTTDVIRGDEWLSSLPVHLQLFYELGWKAPRFAHIAPVMKLEGSSKRKLSKRKDPEAAVSYYHQMGYPSDSVIEYLLNLANSSYEDWRRQNPDAPHEDYVLDMKKMSVSGALFDIIKLNDISKTVISKMTAQKVYDMTLEWAKIYDKEFAALLEADEEYAVRILAIGRGGKKPRKDIAKWSDVKDYMAYFYDELFAQSQPEAEVDKEIITEYVKIFDINDDKDVWFNKIRDMSEALGYAGDMKAYKAEPEKFKGNVGDVSTIIRIAVTNRSNTPDLYDIMQIIGEKRTAQRLNKYVV
ncbi:MAG: glutamate--tRNA ligase [Eubacteriales bacterium]|nr:glutamate--tRNA ligase [Eubacteriales bacterium]